MGVRAGNRLAAQHWGEFKNVDLVALLGMPQYINTSGIPALPVIQLNSDYSSPAENSIGTRPAGYLRQGQETHQVLGTVSWVKGQHELKFGAEGRMHRDNYTQPGTPAGQFSYDFTGTFQFPFSGGGDALASFLIGNGGPGTSGQYEVPNLVSTQSFQAGGFVQDN